MNVRVRRTVFLIAVAGFFVAELPVGAQYPGGGYPPGGYPPGGYPGGYPGRYPGGGGMGIPFPRRGKKKSSKDDQSQKQEAQLHDVSGLLRQLDDTSIVVESKDTRIINLKRTGTTKFFKAGEEIKPAVLKPGDHLH